MNVEQAAKNCLCSGEAREKNKRKDRCWEDIAVTTNKDFDFRIKAHGIEKESCCRNFLFHNQYLLKQRYWIVPVLGRLSKKSQGFKELLTFEQGDFNFEKQKRFMYVDADKLKDWLCDFQLTISIYTSSIFFFLLLFLGLARLCELILLNVYLRQRDTQWRLLEIVDKVKKCNRVSCFAHSDWITFH